MYIRNLNLFIDKFNNSKYPKILVNGVTFTQVKLNFTGDILYMEDEFTERNHGSIHCDDIIRLEFGDLDTIDKSFIYDCEV